ncbi:MAG: hypothetical protein ABIH23_01065 [bacterium]
MAKRWMRVSMVVVVVATVASSGWSQDTSRVQSWLARMIGDTGKYINIVLLLDNETAAKVQALCDAEGEKSAKKMQEIWESAGDDRQAGFEKMRAEREEYAKRIKTGLGGILSEGQIQSIEPILDGRVPSTFRTPEEGGRNPFLWALASISLQPEQRTKMLGVTVPYACGIQPFASRSSREGPSDEEKEKIQKLAESFTKDAGAILTAEQKEKWEAEAAKLREQWDKEREEFRQRRQNR